MGDGLKRAVAAARATRKQKPPKGGVVAIKKRVIPSNAWMPDEVHVRLEGDPDPKSRLLLVCGWSTVPDDKRWLKTRLERYLPKLTKQWEEDFGKSWRLEIRLSG